MGKISVMEQQSTQHSGSNSKLAASPKIGEFLVATGLVSQEDIGKALAIQKQNGGRLGDILHLHFKIRSLDYYQTISQFFGLKFIDLTRIRIDKTLLHEKDRDLYASRLFIPIGRSKNRVIVATADPSEDTFKTIKDRWGQDTFILGTAKFDIFYSLQKIFSANYSHEIISELYDKDPTKSALRTFTFPQMFSASIFLLILGIVMYISYPTGMIILNSFLTISVTVVLLYKFLLSVIGIFVLRKTREQWVDDLDSKTLPVYTILVPMLHEKKITIEYLVKNLTQLDYPVHKLDIKLVIEEDDSETIEHIKELKIPYYFEIVRVPPSDPRTKPKACNYALKFARGEYITIYDAEDRPDPDQLKKAISTFQKGEKNLACVQCSLNYFNGMENWLTKMFTIEYTFWFDLMLPALSWLNLPIPLGGTSNHFKTEFLKEMVAWDPFNVTEDADLGIRMNRLGYKTQAIISTTYEEANCRTINWIKQRTRWLKGYMQTYLVHMRSPFRLYRELGFGGFLSFHLFIGGTIVSNLANIILLVIFVLGIVLGADTIAVLFPHPTVEVAWFNLIAGNILLLLLNFLAVLRRRLYPLLPYVLSVPIYWFLASVAGYRALHQLFFNPSQWEKTEHGISSYFLNK